MSSRGNEWLMNVWVPTGTNSQAWLVVPSQGSCSTRSPSLNWLNRAGTRHFPLLALTRNPSADPEGILIGAAATEGPAVAALAAGIAPPSAVPAASASPARVVLARTMAARGILRIVD